MKYLITGGTVFVSKFIAKYLVEKGHDVYVLNRGTKEQVLGVTLIKADRNDLKDCLNGYHFDVIVDVSAYNKDDIKNLLSQNVSFDEYIFISTCSVYSEDLKMPYNEEQEIVASKRFGDYGFNKVEAEKYLISKVKGAYILRPVYIYGPMQSLYREPFIFECATLKRKFYIPNDGKLKLPFIYIEDLAKVVEIISLTKPTERIYNLSNPKIVSIEELVEYCYDVVGAKLEKEFVIKDVNSSEYFPFANFELNVDTSRLKSILPEQMDIYAGLKASYDYWKNSDKKLAKRPYIDYIDNNLVK